MKACSAYEISSYWGEVPPPPEILENLTAKGADLRSRTLENYPIPTSRESGALADGMDSADEEQRTPKTDAMELDEPSSASRYPTRKLNRTYVALLNSLSTLLRTYLKSVTESLM